MGGDPGLLVIQELEPRKGQGSAVTQAMENVLVIPRRKLNAQVNCDIKKYVFLKSLHTSKWRLGWMGDLV